jgi:hypothetical protein
LPGSLMRTYLALTEDKEIFFLLKAPDGVWGGHLYFRMWASVYPHPQVSVELNSEQYYRLQMMEESPRLSSEHRGEVMGTPESEAIFGDSSIQQRKHC